MYLLAYPCPGVCVPVPRLRQLGLVGLLALVVPVGLSGAASAAAAGDSPVHRGPMAKVIRAAASSTATAPRAMRATRAPAATRNDTATTEIYTLSLTTLSDLGGRRIIRSEESELQSHSHIACRFLLEKKKQ